MRNRNGRDHAIVFLLIAIVALLVGGGIGLLIFVADLILLGLIVCVWLLGPIAGRVVFYVLLLSGMAYVISRFMS